MKKRLMYSLVLVLILIITGCDQQPEDDIGVTLPPPTFESTPIPPESLYIDPGIPTAIRERVNLTDAAGVAYTLADSLETADVTLTFNPAADSPLATRWTYAIAGPFATVPDAISWAGFAAYWGKNDPSGLPDLGDLPTLVLSEADLNALATLIGEPSPDLLLVISGEEALAAELWMNKPALTFLPFERITPEMKVLAVDGLHPLERTLSNENYPLSLPVSLSARTERGQGALERFAAAGALPATNRDVNQLSILTMTGVTAMARATAMQIEIRGYDFPSKEIMPFLSDADILHTSNEVSFTPQCPPPDWFGDLVFCSAPKYLEVLKLIGVDVVEQTGNHVNDYGTAPMTYSLELYAAAGMAYFGGGRNTDDARLPRILTTPAGARIAFIGCNSPGPFNAFASAETPGAAACEDYAWMIDAIRGLKTSDQADLVVATVQHFELASYQPSDQQIADFSALAEAGADIVIGTQAHQPQGFAFSDGAFIHYGIGNLFFDQMDYIENRQMFADKFILYEQRLIGVTLFTGLIEDYAQPRPMTPGERAEFLTMIFGMSGWQ